VLAHAAVAAHVDQRLCGQATQPHGPPGALRQRVVFAADEVEAVAVQKLRRCLGHVDTNDV